MSKYDASLSLQAVGVKW